MFISTLKSSQSSIPPLQSSQFRPPPKPSQFSVLPLKTSNFRPAHKTSSILTRTKHMLTSILTPKPTQLLSPAQNQVNFEPNTGVKSISISTLITSQFPMPLDTKTKSISISTLKTSQFCMPLDTKIKLISTQTLNQVVFDPQTKPSQFWSLHWNQVNSDPPHKITSISTTHTTTNSISMPTLKPCHFRAVLLCVLYIPVHVLVIQQHRE